MAFGRTIGTWIVLCGLLLAPAPAHAGPQPFTWSPGVGYWGRCNFLARNAIDLIRARVYPPDLEKHYGIQIQGEIGRGGMGVVWLGVGKGKDGKLQYLAVKEALPENAPVAGGGPLSKTRVQYLEDEAVSTGKVRVGKTKLIKANGKTYMVTELVPNDPARPGDKGLDLNTSLLKFDHRNKKIWDGPERDEDYILAAETSFLGDVKLVHDAGLIHKDIKPGNVVLGHDEKGNPILVLVDFGLAGEPVSYQETAFAVGTLEFMGREALHNEKVSTERDVRAAQQVLLMLWAQNRFATKTGFIKRGYGEEEGGSGNTKTAQVKKVELPSTGAMDIDVVLPPSSASARTPREQPPRWDAPDRTFDDVAVGKHFNPNVALVLVSHIPTTVPELEKMLAEARDPKTDFVEAYMKRWKLEFNHTTTERREDLVYEIIHTPTLRVKLFEKMSDSHKYEVARIAKKALTKARVAERRGYADPLGWHGKSVDHINAFLNDDKVYPFVPNG